MRRSSHGTPNAVAAVPVDEAGYRVGMLFVIGNWRIRGLLVMAEIASANSGQKALFLNAFGPRLLWHPQNYPQFDGNFAERGILLVENMPQLGRAAWEAGRRRRGWIGAPRR
jgi:hypothetical protein